MSRYNNMLCLGGYPGGKQEQASTITKLLDYKNTDTYIELFGGCASVLLNKCPHDHEIYSEITEELLDIFKCLTDKEKSMKLEMSLIETEYSKEMFDNALQNWKNEKDEIKKATMAMIILLQSKNGDMKSWKGEKDFLKEQHKYENKLLDIGGVIERLENVYICSKGAFTKMDEVKNDTGVMVYIDPPYYLPTRSAKKIYKHEWTNEMHKEFLGIIKDAKCKIVLSAYENELYDDKLKKWDKLSLGCQVKGMRIGYGQRTYGEEFVYMNY